MNEDESVRPVSNSVTGASERVSPPARTVAPSCQAHAAGRGGRAAWCGCTRAGRFHAHAEGDHVIDEKLQSGGNTSGMRLKPSTAPERNHSSMVSASCSGVPMTRRCQSITRSRISRTVRFSRRASLTTILRAPCEPVMDSAPSSSQRGAGCPSPARPDRRSVDRPRPCRTPRWPCRRARRRRPTSPRARGRPRRTPRHAGTGRPGWAALGGPVPVAEVVPRVRIKAGHDIPRGAAPAHVAWPSRSSAHSLDSRWDLEMLADP